MATPRKHWFRCPDSVGAEPWSNDVLATIIRLQAYLNTRWTRDGKSAAEAGRVALRMGDLMVITGKGRADVALTSAGRLADVASISVERRGDVVVIDWPKWSNFQGLKSETRETRGKKLPSPTPTPTPTPEEKNKSEEEEKIPTAAPASPAPLFDPAPKVRAGRKRKVPDPGALHCAEVLDELLEGGGVALRTNGYLAAWAREIELLSKQATDVKANSTPWLLIEAGIRWIFSRANTDAGRFALVVESGRSLREKWPRIVAASKRDSTGSRKWEAMDEWAKTGKIRER